MKVCDVGLRKSVRLAVLDHHWALPRSLDAPRPYSKAQLGLFRVFGKAKIRT
jgi:hypothetical protein